MQGFLSGTSCNQDVVQETGQTVQVTVKSGPLQPGAPGVCWVWFLLSHVIREVWPPASASPVLGSGWLPSPHTLVNADQTHTCCCVRLLLSISTSVFILITCLQWTVQVYYYYSNLCFSLLFNVLDLFMSTHACIMHRFCASDLFLV